MIEANWFIYKSIAYANVSTATRLQLNKQKNYKTENARNALFPVCRTKTRKRVIMRSFHTTQGNQDSGKASNQVNPFQTLFKTGVLNNIYRDFLFDDIMTPSLPGC